MLEFQKKIVEDVLEKNSNLIVLAKGLGIEKIFLESLKLLLEKNENIFVLNLGENYESIIEEMKKSNIEKRKIPIKITTDFNQKERKEIYEKGGCKTQILL
jgi:methyl coenzyme M reductase subunit C-like uncharacterized protein (methanogenesis marker protein 7)